MHRQTVLGFAVLLLVTATPVAAHYTQVNHGSDYAYVTPGHTRVVACDMESDNNGFYAQFYITGGLRKSIYDGSGYQGACGESTSFYYVTELRSCEDGTWSDNCTDWVPA